MGINLMYLELLQRYQDICKFIVPGIYQALWTWVWVNSRSWWWTGRPGVLRFMGLQRVGHDWATELNYTQKFHHPFSQLVPDQVFLPFPQTGSHLLGSTVYCRLWAFLEHVSLSAMLGTGALSPPPPDPLICLLISSPLCLYSYFLSSLFSCSPW